MLHVDENGEILLFHVQARFLLSKKRFEEEFHFKREKLIPLLNLV